MSRGIVFLVTTVVAAILFCTTTTVVADFPVPIPRVEDFVSPIADEVNYRLPNNTKPHHYHVHLETWVNEAMFNFNGTVMIKVEALEATTNITLHSREQTIVSINLKDGDAPVELDTFTYDKTNEFLVIPIKGAALVKGKVYDLTIMYTAILRDDNGGFYRSSYKNAKGETVWLATTQFEQTDARHAFPCFDEPAWKANFTITIKHDPSYNAISNMRVTVRDEGGRRISTFDTTPMMSTYLVAFVVSDFKYIESTAGVYPQRVYTRPNAIEEAGFALEAGMKIIKVLEDYTGVKYALPKMDQIAVPDFSAGAMENWGLITYREEYLLLNPNETAQDQYDVVSTIVAHELAHQWFGNIVSPLWWTYIWLNEGFATLYEYYAADKAYPELRIMHLFNIEAVQSVMGSDALETTRPMTHYVDHPSSVSGLFDNIAYQKSGSVLRMMQQALGDSTFQKGLKYYLVDKSFDAAKEEDLFINLDKAAKEDKVIPDTVTIQAIMQSWTLQKGYPIVHVERNYEDGSLTLSQSRFLLKSKDDPSKSTWWIPFNMATQTSSDFLSPKPDGWMQKGQETLKLMPTAAANWTSDEWVIFNKQQSGYYRVNYDNENWQKIIKELNEGKHDKIHALNRAQLIDDALDLARSGRLAYNVALDLVKYITNERDLIPWKAADANLNYLVRMMSGTPSGRTHVQLMMHAFIKNIYARLGTESVADEHYFNKLARALAIRWECESGDDDCLKMASAKITDYLSGKTLDPNLKSVLLCQGLRKTTVTEYLAVWKRMQDSKDQADRTLLINSLGCSNDKDQLTTLLESTLVEAANYRSTERTRVLAAVYNNMPTGTLIAIDFIKANYIKIDEMFNVFGNTALSSAVSGISQRVVDADTKAKFDDMINTIKDKVSEVTVQRAAETIAENMQWTTTYSKDVMDWLHENVMDHDDGGANSIPTTSALLLLFGAIVAWLQVR